MRAYGPWCCCVIHLYSILKDLLAWRCLFAPNPTCQMIIDDNLYRNAAWDNATTQSKERNMFKSENGTLFREDQEIIDSCNRFDKMILLEFSLLYYCPAAHLSKGRHMLMYMLLVSRMQKRNVVGWKQSICSAMPSCDPILIFPGSLANPSVVCCNCCRLWLHCPLDLLRRRAAVDLKAKIPGKRLKSQGQNSRMLKTGVRQGHGRA